MSVTPGRRIILAKRSLKETSSDNSYQSKASAGFRTETRDRLSPHSAAPTCGAIPPFVSRFA